MSAGVIVLAQMVDAALRGRVEARLALVEQFYAPLGQIEREWLWIPEARVLAVRFAISSEAGASGAGAPRAGASGERSEQPVLWTWGEALPPAIAAARALLEPGRRMVADVTGTSAAFALDPARGRARIVSAPAGPATLYAARGEGVAVWSTHAVAAALVAQDETRLDPAAVPELLGFDFVGGQRTLLEGVTCPSPAADIRLDAGGADASSWLSAVERWALDPEDLAYDRAEARLISTLVARLHGKDVAVALTAGLDSRVVAVGLTEAGVQFEAFTWGSESWPDSQGAAVAAATLDIRHRLFEHQLLEADEVLPEHDRAARWSDGVFALAPATRVWPEADAIVGGMGGETGRAFYYDAWSAWLWPHPDRTVLADRLAARAHLPVASPDAVALASTALEGWLDEAEHSGVTGWRLLDVVYSDQRVRRWGRGQLPASAAPFVPAFTPLDVQRALASQPIDARLISGFHRDFVERHSPELAFEPAAPPSMPPALLRRLHRRRQLHRRAARLGTAAHGSPDSYLAHVWDERSEAREWVVEHALPHGLTGGVMGADWIAWTRSGFPNGARRAGEQARLAAAVVALDDALRSLRRSSAP